MELTALLLLATAAVTNAHFGIEYPPMRGQTLGSAKNNSYSQWVQPCKPSLTKPLSTPPHPNTPPSLQAPASQAT